MQTDWYELYQWAVAYVALSGAVAMFAVALWLSPLGVGFRRRLAELWAGFRRLGAFGQIVVATCLIGVWQYGATKGFWSPVQNSGGDDILTVAVFSTVVPPPPAPASRSVTASAGGTSHEIHADPSDRSDRD